MIILSSPTKQMDFDLAVPEMYKDSESLPVFEDEAVMLNSLLMKLDPAELALLMKCSTSIAGEVYRNIHLFCSPEARQSPAIYAYCGTVFKAVNPGSFNPEEIAYAQAHLRILSGLYGILRPLDLISPYRLEMKTMLEIPETGRLSVFWRYRIASALAADNTLAEPDSIVINLASGEYSRIVDKAVLNRKIINFHFREITDKGLKTVGMYAKTARGLMIRRIITEQVQCPESLKKGITGGYCFAPEFSSEYDWIFVR